MSEASIVAGREAAADWSSHLIEALPAESKELAAVAEMDSRLREGQRKWGAVVSEIEVARRNLVLATGELQRVRRVAEQQRKVKDDGLGPPRRVVTADAEEARRAKLLGEFEGVLRETEARRVVLHGEMADLRRQRQQAIARLSGPIRATYHAAEEAGRVPVIGSIVDDNCSCCRAAVPSTAVSAVGRGAIVVCCGCGRLLRIADVFPGGA